MHKLCSDLWLTPVPARETKNPTNNSSNCKELSKDFSSTYWRGDRIWSLRLSKFQVFAEHFRLYTESTRYNAISIQFPFEISLPFSQHQHVKKNSNFRSQMNTSSGQVTKHLETDLGFIVAVSIIQVYQFFLMHRIHLRLSHSFWVRIVNRAGAGKCQLDTSCSLHSKSSCKNWKHDSYSSHLWLSSEIGPLSLISSLFGYK